jgi:hypothetical protein
MMVTMYLNPLLKGGNNSILACCLFPQLFCLHLQLHGTLVSITQLTFHFLQLRWNA